MKKLEDTTTVSTTKISRETILKRWSKERDTVAIMMPLFSKLTPKLSPELMVNTIMRTTLKTSQKELIHSPLSKEELPCQESKNKRNGKIITRIPPLESKEIERLMKILGMPDMLKRKKPNLLNSFKLVMSTTATKTTLKISQMD
jgi:hypothetical protein